MWAALLFPSINAHSELRLVDLLMFLQTKHPETSRNNQILKVFLSLMEFKLLSALSS